MRTDSIYLEEKRLESVNDITDYRQVHERHRIFPQVFEDRNHKKVLDISAGVGVVASRIKEKYSCEIYCNDTSPKCIKLLEKMNFPTYSFDLDDEEAAFPIPDETFDAVICLATVEHLINTEHFFAEVRRILKTDGCFYISAPNYNALSYLIPLIKSGKTFHDPMNKVDEYEFFAHVRYFTYRTLLEYSSRMKFTAEAVYLGLPEGSSKFLNLKKKSPVKAFAVRKMMAIFFNLFSPRWHSEPVICLRKSDGRLNLNPQKVLL